MKEYYSVPRSAPLGADYMLHMAVNFGRVVPESLRSKAGEGEAVAWITRRDSTVILHSRVFKGYPLLDPLWKHHVVPWGKDYLAQNRAET